MNLTETLKENCYLHGADLVGIADIKEYKDTLNLLDRELIEKFPYAISIAVRLDKKILDEIDNGPTAKYADHYREINQKLDKIANRVCEYIKSLNHNAFHIEASKVVDEKNLGGIISHKAIARLAGIGWQGKSLLIINPEIGPRFRLVTVLTDMPLVCDKPLKNRCGKCTLCTKHCPANAIRNVNTDSYYACRQDAIDLCKCYQKLLSFKELPSINATVCGVCISVCPFGRKKS